MAGSLLFVLALLVGVSSSASGDCLRPPVEGVIVRAFEGPPCPWCAGHRGITYAVAPGTPVRAAAAGVVTFSGVVVDIRYVVVRHADGLLATYGGLRSTSLPSGAVVGESAIVGYSGAELYFGLRTGPDRYIDPQPLLGALTVPPYLVPTDGSAGRPPPEPVLRCRPV
jgi:murein DD-endopeptidase MepM/ murein hydrolase activator NlpD